MADDYIPRLTNAVFEEYKNREAELVRKCEAGEFSEGMLKIQREWLEEWFKKQYAPEDKRVFPNTTRLREFLVQRMSFGEAQEFIQHEMEHADMAGLLGYETGYGVYLMRDEQGGTGFRPFCSFKGEITPEHWRLINQASYDLSDTDRLAGSGS
ncbi:MAG TPA: hypothetical protein VJH95_01545 [Candidatus Nanoarchaeia archaeon]|nr:hypothetical protein [Candidatus Nanoarchaeia archaeon]